ncbi:LPS assembly lipoprotein LptE [Modicisalibacter xianhensis]|uniref:LPS-assembly lipoprotein LptE n=1 Tax=Modicisalibacter xianhensis TaxID=442341 RepID=A0A1I3CQW9_9GAMM|nr:LPS assembly lipoprotein LptE [Halomonas xianhensis]SFH76930.1 Lipopolysaccharide-assembly [Halomonas xianhensis]
MKRRTFLAQSLAALGVGIVGSTLGGCGFHLRGTQRQPMPFDAVDLQATPSLLTDEVSRTLENAGVVLSDQAPLILNLGDERVENISLRGGDMINDEIELRMTAPYSVQRRSDNAYLIAQGQLESATTYLVNNDDPLVRDELQANALAELRDDLSRQLLARLSTLTP